MDATLQSKYEKLKEEFSNKDRIGIAYSGGVDSTLLLHIAKDVVGSKVSAITIVSEFYPSWELEYAVQVAQELQTHHKIISIQPLQLSEIANNPPTRCYTCKKHGFTLLKEYCIQYEIDYICDGSCIDDLTDYRPGYKAIQELQISSPFIEFDFNKHDIIELSKELGITGWSRPSCACLASRIPYNNEITLEKLKLIDNAEGFLHTLGLPEARVRLHNNIARIEVYASNLDKAYINKEAISSYIKNLGATYVSLELDGYKTGSMNKILEEKNNNNAN